MENDLFEGSDAIAALEQAGVTIIRDELGARISIHPETEVREVSPSKHSAVVTFATGKYCFRDGCRLVMDGADLKQFRKNAVVLWSHNYNLLPIAHSPRVTVSKDDGGKLIGVPKFHMATELSREVWALIEQGVLRAWSLGFIPNAIRKLRPEEVGLKPASDAEHDSFAKGEGDLDLRAGDVRFDITRFELLEYSSVCVPADPHALTDSIRALHEGGRSAPALEQALRDAGVNVPELVPAQCRDTGVILERQHPSIGDEYLPDAWARVEETEDFIHVPVRDKGLFIPETFRNINISKKEGITAVAGKLKKDGEDGPMVVQKYLFAKDKGWTVSTATEWVDAHKKALDEWAARLQEADAVLEEADFVTSGDSVVLNLSGMDLPALLKSMADSAVSERVGKVLSKATRTKLSKVAELMREAAESIDSILDGADKHAEPEESEEVGETPPAPRKVSGQELVAVLRGE